MTLTEQYDGSGDPLEGDRTIEWRSLPVGAQVSQATITITPVPAPDGTLFEEIVSFTQNPGSLGATKNSGSDFVEIDFHKRRTLAAVTGTLLLGATLQVNVGGLYVEINDKGAILSPTDPTLFQVDSSGLLPGLIVSKFRLSGAPSSYPDVGSVTIRSVPTNLSVRLQDLRPFWTIAGEVTTSATSADFSAALQKLLATASVENGYYVVPLTVHSDSVARLTIEIDCEYANQVSLLSGGLSQAALAYDYGTLPKPGVGALSASLPAGALILPGQTSAQVSGTFSASRIAPDVGLPPGTVPSGAVVEVSPTESQAQPIQAKTAVSATSVDLLLAATSSSAQLSLDIRPDVNGKPDQASLLPEPVQFTVASNAARQLQWVNVPLPGSSSNFEPGQRYWLVLASLEGDCNWDAEPSGADLPGLQHSLDGGLSWRDAGAVGIPGQAAAAFHLRTTPQSFQVPLQLQVGGARAVPVSLDRYQPLGQVSFALNSPELARAFNTYLTSAVAPPPPEGEHLANGGFDSWMVVPGAMETPYRLSTTVADIAALALSPDGRWIYLATYSGKDTTIRVIDAACESARRHRIVLPDPAEPRRLAVHPSGTRAYFLTAAMLHLLDLDGYAEKGTPLTADLLAHVTGATPGETFGPNLALSPDGLRLYLSLGNGLLALPTAAVEAVVSGLRPLVRQDVTVLPLAAAPGLMVLNPDGTSLFVTTPGSSAIQLVDTASLTMEPGGIDLGGRPVSIDFTPDGKVAAVATVEDDALSFVDTASGSILESRALPAAPQAVAVSPDGTRSYLLLSQAYRGGMESPWLALPELVLLDTMPLWAMAANALRAVALSPQGDRLYLASPEDLRVVPVGTRTPSEWSVVSDNPGVPGQVVPICFPPEFPFALGLQFGRRKGQEIEPNPAATGLAQVVPAAPSCPFDFSFWALADDSQSAAELFWLDGQSSLLRKDTVPIQAQAFGTVGILWERGPWAVLGGELWPMPHGAHFTSPAGTAQVEVRFTIPRGSSAVLAQASLDATSDAVANGELQIFDGSLPAGWSFSTPAARGVSITPGAGSVQFSNSSLADAELVQNAAVQPGADFTFEFLGKVVQSATPAQQAQVTLEIVQADGSQAAPPVSLQVPTVSFGRYLATGAFPGQAAQAAIRLRIPPGMMIEIGQVSLTTLTSSPVPMTFLSEAPGELRISNPVVTYNRIPVPPPPVPAGGLASPTPPGQTPGQPPPPQTYCTCCGAQQTMSRPRLRLTAAGRPVTVGRCPVCSSELLCAGGTPAAGAPRLPFPLLPAPEQRPAGLLRRRAVRWRAGRWRKAPFRLEPLPFLHPTAGAKPDGEEPRRRRRLRARAQG